MVKEQLRARAADLQAPPRVLRRRLRVCLRSSAEACLRTLAVLESSVFEFQRRVSQERLDPCAHCPFYFRTCLAMSMLAKLTCCPFDSPRIRRRRVSGGAKRPSQGEGRAHFHRRLLGLLPSHHCNGHLQLHPRPGTRLQGSSTAGAGDRTSPKTSPAGLQAAVRRKWKLSEG